MVRQNRIQDEIERWRAENKRLQTEVDALNTAKVFLRAAKQFKRWWKNPPRPGPKPRRD